MQNANTLAQLRHADEAAKIARAAYLETLKKHGATSPLTAKAKAEADHWGREQDRLYKEACAIHGQGGRL